MTSALKTKLRIARPALLAATVTASLLGLIGEAWAAGYTVQEINAPGAAVRMSSAGYLTGTYVVKCGWVGHKPRHRICWYAPWYYDGNRITKVNWPVEWNYVYSLGINDSLDLIGREYRGSVSAGGWLYSGGVLTYSGSLEGYGGSLLAAINNAGVAVGTAQTSAGVSRAVTFENVGGTYGLLEVPAFADPAIPTTGADINDEGHVAGTFVETDGSRHAFAYVDGETLLIPDLPGETWCQAVRISQEATSGQLWVAGTCNYRGFLWTSAAPGEVIELNNLDGLSGGVSVQSVNGWGEAVGTVAGRAVMWSPDDPTATAIDLNQYAPGNAMFTRGTDINDSGTILATEVDAVGNIATFLLTPTP